MMLVNSLLIFCGLLLAKSVIGMVDSGKDASALYEKLLQSQKDQEARFASESAQWSKKFDDLSRKLEEVSAERDALSAQQDYQPRRKLTVDTSTYTGVRVQREKAVVALGPNDDVAIVRTGVGKAYFKGNVETSGVFKVGTTSSACDTSMDGFLRYSNKKLMICDGTASKWWEVRLNKPPATCSLGKARASAAAFCTNCAKGKYQSNGKLKSGTCRTCPSGKYAGAQMSGSCKTCSTSKFQDKAGKSSCKQCPTGKSAKSDRKSCVTLAQASCKAWKAAGATSSGVKTLSVGGKSTSAYCDMTTKGGGWTLIARFSNKDAKNWMKNGAFWYDRTTSFGKPTSLNDNADMYNPAFHMVKASEFMVTRTDKPTQALMTTTGNCLGGKTFRGKLTGYGNYRTAVWGSNSVKGTCSATFGGSYSSTPGFTKAKCSGNIGKPNGVSFWADWSAGDGSVILVGGGGNSCNRADHGIGVTEENAAKFGGTAGYNDFGKDGGSSSSNAPTSYSINLYVR